MSHPYPGLLIAFEGIDGCGKGTQIELAYEWLTRNDWGHRVVLFKQPGGTALGDKIRDILFKDPTTHNMDADAISLLYLASHLQGVADIVLPALAEGKVVLSDRWDLYSGTVFGDFALDRPVSHNVQDCRRRMHKVTPDLTLLLHGEVITLMERAHGRTGEKHQAGKVWAPDGFKMQKMQTSYETILTHGQDRSALAKIRADIGSPLEIFERVKDRILIAITTKFNIEDQAA